MPALYKKGFTAVEILVVVAIIAILASIIISSFSGFRNSSVLQTTGEDVISILNKARTQTIAAKDGYQYGVHFTASDATLFRGTSYVFGDSNNEVHTLDSALQISSITLAGGGSDVVFQTFTGKTTQYGTVTIRVTSDTTKNTTVNIDQTGVVGFQ